MPQSNYVRQSSFNNGDIADATQVNAEFDQLVSAFHVSTGHTHDGGAGLGSPVPLISDLTGVTKLDIDTTTDVNNHVFTWTLDGVAVMTLDETSGLTIPGGVAIDIEDLSNVANTPVGNAFLKWNAGGTAIEFSTTLSTSQLTEIGTPAANGYFKWDGTASTILYSTTIPAGDISGLDSTAITHNGGNLDTHLDTVDTLIGDAAAQAAAAALSAADAAADAALADADRIDAEAARIAAEAAQAAAELAETNAEAAVADLPTYVADGGTHTILNTDQWANLVFEGDGTLVLPTVLTKGRRFIVRLSFKAVSTKVVTMASPSFPIYAPGESLIAGDSLTLAPGDMFTLECISTTELEIIQ